LQYLVFEALWRNKRFRLFDFTEGEGAHKEFFSTGSVLCADAYYLRFSLRNLILVGTHSSLVTLSRSAAVAVEKLALKARMKKWLRRRSTLVRVPVEELSR
jgi:hypothetical protein